MPPYLQDSIVVGSLLELALPHETAVAALNSALVTFEQSGSPLWGLSASFLPSGLLLNPEDFVQHTGRADVAFPAVNKGRDLVVAVIRLPNTSIYNWSYKDYKAWVVFCGSSSEWSKVLCVDFHILMRWGRIQTQEWERRSKMPARCFTTLKTKSCIRAMKNVAVSIWMSVSFNCGHQKSRKVYRAKKHAKCNITKSWSLSVYGVKEMN